VDLPLISSTRGTTAAVLILGVVGGCALGGAGEAYGERARTRETRIFIAIANVGGVIALIAAVVGLVFGSEIALAILVAATVGLWVIATSRHAFTTPAHPDRGRDHHEVISR
jgi:zinc transporter ZupT